MVVITGTGTTLGLELEIASGAPALFVLYKRLGTNTVNGTVFGPARTQDLVVPEAECAALVARFRNWVGEISANQSIVPVALADLPLELDSAPVPLVTPTGIHYEIKMGDLQVEINWDKTRDDVTIQARFEFTISYEAFIYYVETLEDLIRAIEVEKLA